MTTVKSFLFTIAFILAVVSPIPPQLGTAKQSEISSAERMMRTRSSFSDSNRAALAIDSAAAYMISGYPATGIACLNRYLELAPTGADAPTERRILAYKIELLSTLEQRQQAESLFQSLTAESSVEGRQDQAFSLPALVALHLYRTGQYKYAVKVANTAIRQAENISDTDVLAEALYCHAMLMRWEGLHQEAESDLSRAVMLQGTTGGPQALRVQYLTALAEELALLGRLPESREIYLEAYDAARTHPILAEYV